ncbi:Pro-resilin [Orchesella cincta]|uniref:Pro-resilin n=1 Tax=Orchesella cincta TaxID=48709 RepID=A0A1D2MZ86_ORCCI|nr:Pro-resilin [Orchesella cincta]
MFEVFCFTLITVFLIVITVVAAQSPVDEVTDEENEEVARPIRASPRKRVRSRNNNNKSNENRGVQKRRLPGAFRPTRAPLFEASPPDPFLDGEIGPNGHNGHSHSPPTRDPYYSPSRFEREKKRTRIRLTSEAPLRNSFDVSGSTEYNNNGNEQAYNVPGKNYAFAYAVGDNSEDFSHKQAKAGQITIGEYRITLPDGRTQVVRYTAGGKHGYKADVTYESSGQSQELPPAGPSPSYHRHKLSGQKQYHASVQPTPFAPSPAPSFNSDRVYKSRPLKTTALYGEDDDDEYQHQHQRGTPKITFKGGNGPRAPTPTPEYAYNGVSTTPTPRPNSIYDKISPYRGGGNVGKQGYKLDDLAYAHENSPRAGPVRSKTRNLPVPEAPQKGRSTAASYYDTQQIQPHSKIKVSSRPTKKYKDPAFYYAGPQQSHQSQVNHVNSYVGPKHFQYLQETPAQAYSPSPSPVPKQLKQSHRHVVPLEQYKSGGPIRVAYNNYNSPKPRKQKKKYGIHQPLGQYLVQTPATAETPTYQPTSPALLPKEPFHYYNSFHSAQHHGFGQISPSPTPSVSTNSLNHQQYPSPYPVTAYPTKPYQGEHVTPTQHRLRLPSPPSTSGHVYLETPASGARPNRLGIKEALSRLPNIPEAKTTVHPYEVGSVDYGKGVGYGNIPVDPDNIEPGVQRGYEGFPFNGVTEANLDPTSFFSAGGAGDDQYFQNEQFNFLGGLNNFDIEQANVREIRQPKQRRRRQRRPGKRRGLPITSAPQETEAAPTPSQQSSQSETQPPKRRQQPTTSRGKGKRRRMRTQQPDPMMHAVESRRSRRPRNSSEVSEN